MSKWDKWKAGLAILIVFLVGLFVTNLWAVKTTIDVNAVEYPIYHVTAPFGILWIETTGGGRFIFGCGGFDIDSQMSEEYIVKYMAGNELRTKIFDATKVSVIPDGTFQLEKVTRHENVRYLSGRIDQYNLGVTWYIHVPFLPKMNQTVTTEWSWTE